MLIALDYSNNALKPIKWYKSLAAGKGRLEAEAFIVEGDKAIKQIISNNPGEIIEILSAEELSPFYRKYTSRLITNSQLRSICSAKRLLILCS